MGECLDKWLEARGLDPQLAAFMGWREKAGRSGDPVLAIPFVRNGEVRNVQYRSLTKKEFRFQSGKEVELWNIDALHEEDDHPLIIAEGALDGLAIMQAGEPRVIAVPGWSATNASGRDYEWFQRLEPTIKERCPRIIVARHDDDTGSALLQAVANFFEDCSVSYAQWPADCNDANDVLMKHGELALKHALTHPKMVDPPGMLICDPAKIAPVRAEKIYKIGDDLIDKHMAFATGDISVLTGMPAAGKTTFVMWLSYRLVKQNKCRIGACLFEKKPHKIVSHLRHLGITDDERLDYFRFCHRLDTPANDANDLGWLRKAIRTLAVREGCDVIFIDPWNELDHMLSHGETMTQYANFALKMLRQWADAYSCHICIVAHPRKIPYDRLKKCVTGYDVADSAAFYNKPAMGWTLHMLEEDDVLQLYTWKVRDREDTGCRPGKVTLKFNVPTLKYEALSDGKGKV